MSEFILANQWVFLILFLWLVVVSGLAVISIINVLFQPELTIRAEQRRIDERP